MKERRRFVRVAGLKKIKYKLKRNSGQTREVWVKDLSLIGISFQAEEKLDKGTVLELTIALPHDPDALFLEGEVIWQLPRIKDEFRTGVRLHHRDIKVKERLSKFIYECAKRVEEKREFIRCALEIDVRISFLNDPGREYQAKSCDISRGGMKLLIKDKIKLNTRVRLFFKLPETEKVIESEGKVIWLHERGNDNFEVGVMFAKVEKEDKDTIWQFIEDYCKLN